MSEFKTGDRVQIKSNRYLHDKYLARTGTLENLADDDDSGYDWFIVGPAFSGAEGDPGLAVYSDEIEHLDD